MLILGSLLWTTTGAGAPPPTPPVVTTDDRPKGTAEWLGPPYQDQRSSESIRRSRALFGIPEVAAEVIVAIAERQAVATAPADEQRRFEELTRELELRSIEFQGRYLQALSELRAEMLVAFKEEQELEDVLALLAIAASVR